MFHKDLTDVKLRKTYDFTTSGSAQILGDQLPERWVGRAGPTPWPPWPPDLNQLDFSLWGCFKEHV